MGALAFFPRWDDPAGWGWRLGGQNSGYRAGLGALGWLGWHGGQLPIVGAPFGIALLLGHCGVTVENHLPNPVAIMQGDIVTTRDIM